MATVRDRDEQGPQRRRRARRVRIGTPDRRLTAAGGLEAMRELDRVLGITTALDGGIGPVKVACLSVSGQGDLKDINDTQH